MRTYDLISPEGTCDLVLGDCTSVRYVEEKLREMFRLHGYTEVMTPELEFYDVFDRKSRCFPQETLYKLTDSKGRLLVVRPDSTMPIARVVATRLRDSGLPVRLYYSQNVCRCRPGMRGRSDEIRQTGIELIGSSSKRADTEVLLLAAGSLETVEQENYRLEIGHIGYFRELMKQLGADEDTEEEIRGLIEVKNYPALCDLLDSYGSSEAARTLKMLPRLFGGTEAFAEADKLFSNDETRRVLCELKNIYDSFTSNGFGEKVTVDLGIMNSVNRSNYYTGLVIKGYISSVGEPVLSGGRYDRLLSDYGYDVPAIGFAVNVDAAAKLLRRKGGYVPKAPDVLVFGKDGSELMAAMHCRKLAAEGLISENSVASSEEEAAAYAREKGIHRIDIVDGNTVTVREDKADEQ
ncbi:MAG: ATP phosphoribosyltransferase regulatory subunit [Oscillospiraceae bacterium]|nr:ATP phosphoribosyltransferase regulatory subunit [Oscillospiraceae bacterium]MBQ4310135.1 ATP phosphoribosyltransferase regulatory subunit [Oscillospiraceae bacterium]